MRVVKPISDDQDIQIFDKLIVWMMETNSSARYWSRVTSLDKMSIKAYWRGGTKPTFRSLGRLVRGVNREYPDCPVLSEKIVQYFSRI